MLEYHALQMFSKLHIQHVEGYLPQSTKLSLG